MFWSYLVGHQDVYRVLVYSCSGHCLIFLNPKLLPSCSMICLSRELESLVWGILKRNLRLTLYSVTCGWFLHLISTDWRTGSLLSARGIVLMASSDDTFSRVFDRGVEEEEPFYAPDDDVLTLLRPTSPPTMSSTKNIPKPPPLPCITYQRFQACKRKPSSLSCLVPKEAVQTWDKLFKEGFGADTIVEIDNKSWFPAHSSVLVSSC